MSGTKGNGADIGTVVQMLQNVLVRMDRIEAHLATTMRDVGTLKGDVGTLKGDVGTLKGDVAEMKLSIRRQEAKLALYHDAVVGQGIAAQEIEQRVSRLEERVFGAAS